jgi:hypothetical protein
VNIANRARAIPLHQFLHLGIVSVAGAVAGEDSIALDMSRIGWVHPRGVGEPQREAWDSPHATCGIARHGHPSFQVMRG